MHRNAGPVSELFDGPIDVVGDVHGEREALENLLRRLGYDDQGRHAEGRRLVFVGDLIDRGPDSPGVLEIVIRLVTAGRAQCVLGNHELNALRDDPSRRRPGEGWWYGRRDPGHASVVVSADAKERTFTPFLHGLPAALERQGLRVVHACWEEPAIEKLRASKTVLGCFEGEQARLGPLLEDLARKSKAALAAAGTSLAERHSPEKPFAYVPEFARFEEQRQMGNPVKVVTSGIERPAEKSFFASAKWRVVERVRWWESYEGVPVVVGHYWRRYHALSRDTGAGEEQGEPGMDLDLFGATPPDVWLGAAERVMCVDYSAGVRFLERRRGRVAGDFDHCLAALRIPEWQLVFDDGRPGLSLRPPG